MLDISHKQYLAWKRKNVTVRGIADNRNEDNNGLARFGQGLYTAALSNISMARKYGKLYYVVNAIPKTPKIFNDTNLAEIWLQGNIRGDSISKEMLEMGYDGLIVKGREMVNYAPPDDVLYFENERGLEMYYDNQVALGKI